LRTTAFTLTFAVAGFVSVNGAAGQTAPPAHRSGPTAFVYVSDPGGANQPPQSIWGYAVAQDGSLSPIPGSPFSSQEVAPFAFSGPYLFTDAGGTSILTYAVAPNGSIAQVNGTNASNNPPGGGGPTSLFVDTTGTTLYDLFYSSPHAYQAFAVQRRGTLNFVNDVATPSLSDGALSFTANDVYGYASGCYQGTPDINGYTRARTGALSLTWSPATPPLPAVANPPGVYCPTGAAAWGSQHVVIAMQTTDDITPTGPYQLAVYTVNQNGSLTTTNTAASMPVANVGTVNDYQFDPTHTWLAVGGTTGIEIFAFQNGVLTPAGSYSMSGGAYEVRWDDAGHLMTFGTNPGDLYVFNVAKGVPTVGPGSPVSLQPYGYLGVKPVD
jgi:hypothetical protein